MRAWLPTPRLSIETVTRASYSVPFSRVTRKTCLNCVTGFLDCNKKNAGFGRCQHFLWIAEYELDSFESELGSNNLTCIAASISPNESAR